MSQDNTQTTPSDARHATGPVSVIGCGWLGFPLAQRLLQLDFEVIGSTTRAERLTALRYAGIQGVLLRLESEHEAADDLLNFQSGSISMRRLFGSPQIVVTVPPAGAYGSEDYVGRLRALVRRVPAGSLKHLIFISSTSVYGNAQGEVDEQTEPRPEGGNGAILLDAEHFLASEARRAGFALTIIRAAGLVGFGRHPGRFLAGRSGVKDPDHPVNLVHQLDLVECLATLLLGKPQGERPQAGQVRIFNAVAASHPSRSEFYTRAALRLDLPPPTFAPQETAASIGKSVSGASLKEATGVKFQFDDLLQALEDKRL